MPTFIDESGDTGVFGLGGKPYFRLAAVWVPTFDHAEAFRSAGRALRQRLGLRADYEFKFASTANYPERRRAFFAEALGHEFRFAVCAIDKSHSYWRDAHRDELHWACSTSLAACLRPSYHEQEARIGAPLRERIAVDRNDDREFLTTVTKAFRGLRSVQRPRSTLVGKVQFHKSGPDDMIQLVDMVCGAVGEWIDGAGEWYGMIRCREAGVIQLP